MSDLAAQKAAARKVAFARRAEAHAAAKPGTADLLSSVVSRHWGVPLSGYMAIRTEIDPRPVMTKAAAHGPVGVPVIEAPGLPLKFSRWTPDTAVREGPFGALIPEMDDFLEPEILIVPLVAFTRAGNRLGYGGGFYDRTLAELRRKRPTLAIGFAYAAQEAAELPVEPTDQPLDMIVTESGIFTGGVSRTRG